MLLETRCGSTRMRWASHGWTWERSTDLAVSATGCTSFPAVASPITTTWPGRPAGPPPSTIFGSPATTAAAFRSPARGQRSRPVPRRRSPFQATTFQTWARASSRTRPSRLVTLLLIPSHDESRPEAGACAETSHANSKRTKDPRRVHHPAAVQGGRQKPLGAHWIGLGEPRPIHEHQARCLALERRAPNPQARAPRGARRRAKRVIETPRQYQVTLEQAARFEKALGADASPAELAGEPLRGGRL